MRMSIVGPFSQSRLVNYTLKFNDLLLLNSTITFVGVKFQLHLTYRYSIIMCIMLFENLIILVNLRINVKIQVYHAQPAEMPIMIPERK